MMRENIITKLNHRKQSINNLRDANRFNLAMKLMINNKTETVLSIINDIKDINIRNAAKGASIYDTLFKLKESGFNTDKFDVLLDDISSELYK